MLQHRGQDTAGISTSENNVFHTFKKNNYEKCFARHIITDN